MPHKNFFILFVLLGMTFSSPLYGAVKDSDTDGLTDQAETEVYLTNPQNADSDSDGIDDGTEVLNSTNPLKAEALTEPLSSHGIVLQIKQALVSLRSFFSF